MEEEYSMKNLFCFGFGLALLLTPYTSSAQREATGGGAIAASNPALDTTVVYRLGNATTVGFRDTVTARFYVVERTGNDSLNRIDVKFYWTEGEMTYVTSRKGAEWKNASLSLSPSLTDTSISFVDSGFTAVFDSTQAVVEVDFLVDCVDLGDTTRAQFRFDSTNAPNANRYFR
jgi:hypothetical protein